MTQESRRRRQGRAAGEFERRARRAEALARESSSAAAPLTFAAGLYRAQGELAGVIESAAPAGLLERDLPGFAGGLAGILGYAAGAGPPGLGAEARDLAGAGAGGLGGRLVDWWRGDRSGRADYLARALLRPYAEVLAELAIRPEPATHDGGCPFCQAPAWIGFRRAEAGESGAQRFLGCGLCGGAWPVNRIRCPSCGEEAPDRLPMFQSERYPSVRLEVCDSCKHYVKSIDLTVDGLAIPEVDDLSSVSMDLWAGERGYSRSEPSLAGI